MYLNFELLSNLKAFIYVLSCETLKMFWFIGSMFWNLPHMEVECNIVYVEYIVEIGKIVHNVDACWKYICCLHIVKYLLLKGWDDR